MLKIEKLGRKFLLLMTVFLLTAACVMTAAVMRAEAAVSRKEIVALQTEQDLVVLFSFDSENVEIAFVSPSGTRFTRDDENVEFAEGELWSTYRVKNASAGKWSVEYELGKNSEIQYSILEENFGLWIQYLRIDSVTEQDITVSFQADWESRDIWYNYEIWAVDEAEQQEAVKLSGGTAAANEEKSVTARLNNLNSGSYTLRLEVNCKDGDAEAFDTMTGESFSYVNPNQPKVMEDCNVYLDLSSHSLKLDWGSAGGWNVRGYRVSVTGTEEIYRADLPSDVRETFVTYPEDETELVIRISCQEGSLWSEPLTKTLNLQGEEYLRTETGDVTGASQVLLEYGVTGERTLTLTVNEGEPAELLLQETGQMGVSLQQGINQIFAELAGENGITYVLDKTVYLDVYPPEIVLYDDLDGKTFFEDYADIIGKTEGGTLTANGGTVIQDENGSFRYRFPLADGENILELRAEDENGNASVRVLTLYRGRDSSVFTSGIAGLKKNLPLILSLGGSLFITLLAVLFLKKVDKKEKKPGREKRRGRDGNKKWILAPVVLFVLEAGSVFALVRLSLFTRSAAYLTLAERSISQAAVYLRLRDGLVIVCCVGLGLFVLSLLPIILAARRRSPKQENQKEKTE